MPKQTMCVCIQHSTLIVSDQVRIYYIVEEQIEMHLKIIYEIAVFKWPCVMSHVYIKQQLSPKIFI